jgi:hypothetical protein
VRPALEIRGLDAIRKRFAALGAVKDLTVADAARERLRERDPNSQLAQSIKIMELEAGDHPAFAPKGCLSLACPSFARSFTGC